MESRRSGYLYALASAVSAAVMAVCAKWVLETLSPLSLAWLSNVAAALLLTGWIEGRSAWGRLSTLRGEGWKWLLGLSALFFFAIWFFWLALEALDASIVSFLNRLETVITVFLGVWLLRERFRGREVLGGALVLAGMLIICYAGEGPISQGFWLVVASSILFGVVEVLAKRVVMVVDPLILTWGRNTLLAGAFALLAYGREGALSLTHSPAVWIGVAAVAASGPVLSRLFYLRALQHIEVSKTALLSQSQPLWVAVLALIFLEDSLTWREWLGGGVILGGCTLLVLEGGMWRSSGLPSVHRQAGLCGRGGGGGRDLGGALTG